MDQLKLPPNATSIAEARRFVAHAAAASHSNLTDVACLVVSELATNAVHHGATDYTVGVESLADRLRVTVHDQGNGVPVRREPGLTEIHGRGLQIVNALADTWGIATTGGLPGKTVWFELFARPAS